MACKYTKCNIFKLRNFRITKNVTCEILNYFSQFLCWLFKSNTPQNQFNTRLRAFRTNNIIMSSWSKNILLGSGSVIISNSCYLAVSYIAKHEPVSPGEIMATRSVLQVIIFGTIFMLRGIKMGNEPLKFTWKIWVAMALANLLLTFMQIMSFVTVKMLPLSDFIVLVFTSPVFTILCSACILRYNILIVYVFHLSS